MRNAREVIPPPSTGESDKKTICSPLSNPNDDAVLFEGYSFVSATRPTKDGFGSITTSKGGSLITIMLGTLLGKKKPSRNFRERHVFAQ